MPTIVFLPSGKSLRVETGTRLSDACRRAGFPVRLPCGGKGLCGKCQVRVVGLGWQAACVFRIDADLEVEEPDASASEVLVSDFAARDPDGPSGWWCRDVVLPPPAADDTRDDQTRLFAALADIGPQPLALELLRQLPVILRTNNFACRVAGLDNRIMRLDAPATCLGLAVDLGTTTMAATLCDLVSGQTIATVSRANPQSTFGDDVISRMEYASAGQQHQRELSRLVQEAIRDMADEACQAAGQSSDILAVSVAANTVMNHLLLEVPTTGMATSPFAPVFTDAAVIKDRQLMQIVPNIAGFVGGDITAGLLAHDLQSADGPCLFLDVGTNGEMALAHNGRIIACATAAGPAFEGARISRGMRAAPGAIARVELTPEGDIDVGVLGEPTPAVGICGTGLMDAIAVLLSSGILDGGGRLLEQPEAYAAGGAAAKLAARLFRDGDGAAFWLVRPAGRGVAGVALTQKDVREFQLAKGAIAAGVLVLLAAAGVAALEVKSVLLAGGFGNFLSPVSAVRTGLLPAGIAAERVRAVGNAALAGARLYLLSEKDREAASALARRVEYIELSGRKDFESAFAEEMLFSSK